MHIKVGANIRCAGTLTQGHSWCRESKLVASTFMVGSYQLVLNVVLVRISIILLSVC